MDRKLTLFTNHITGTFMVGETSALELWLSFKSSAERSLWIILIEYVQLVQIINMKIKNHMIFPLRVKYFSELISI